MRLSAAIESVAMVDDTLRARAYGDVWPAIWSERNRIAHGYLVVDRTIIMATVDNDLGELEDGLRSIEADVAEQLIHLLREADPEWSWVSVQSSVGLPECFRSAS